MSLVVASEPIERDLDPEEEEEAFGESLAIPQNLSDISQTPLRKLPQPRRPLSPGSCVAHPSAPR